VTEYTHDHTLNNIASVHAGMLQKCGKMSYKDQISGSLTTGVSLSEYNTDDVFVHVRDIHTFLHRTAISAIKVTFLLNPSKVEVCLESGSCD